MPLEDVFSDVSFPDAQISLTGENIDPGKPAGDPGQGGENDPQPPIKESGQEGKEVTDPSKVKEPEPAKPEGNKDGQEKPLPYDQDPKWKAARAAEKTLTEILESNQFLDPQDIIDAIQQGKTFKETLGDNSIEDLLNAKSELADIKSKLQEQALQTRQANETPEEAYERIKSERDELQQYITDLQTREAEKTASKESIAKYENNVNRVLDSLENPLSEDLRNMALMLLGVNNTAITTDIEDVQAVRQMVKDNVNIFTSFVENVRQKAIDDYAAGKLKLKVSDPASEKESSTETAKRKSIDPKASVDEVFGEANKEFAEILTKGLQAMQ